MDDFHRIPQPKPIPYKYYEPLPKKKSQRKQLPAEPCRDCEKYYASFPDSETRARSSCRHRYRNKRPNTPPHFWDLDFPEYDIPLERWDHKPLWQNKYHDTVEMDRSLYDGLHIRLIPYFNPQECSNITRALEREIVYLPDELCCAKMKMRDASFKLCKVPRKVAAYGDANTEYTFSGTRYPAQPWTPILKHLRDVAYELTGKVYNFVLVNRYRDGKDYIGPHRDDESDLDPKSTILSFSFGAERRFVFTRPHFPSFELNLPSGSVLMMKPPTNRYWYHALPKQLEVKNFRINLTFRRIIPRNTSGPISKGD